MKLLRFFRRRTLLLTALMLSVVVIAVLWKARHRIRGVVEQQQREQRARQQLEIPADGSPEALPPAIQSDEDWHGWRGPHFSNAAVGNLPPMHWSETEGVLWKVPVAGLGHSSPCVMGNRVFLTTAIEDRKLQQVLCLDFKTGASLWTTDAHQGEFIYRNLKNSHASSTPVSDGTFVFVTFAINGHIWLTSLSMDGTIQWQTEAGPYVSKEGFGASPVIAGNCVIVAADNVNQSWIAGLHRRTGEILWRRPRGSGTSYGSPAVIRDGGRELVVMAGLNRVAAIRPDSGDEVWQVPGPDMSASTPAFGDDLLVVTGCTADSGVYAIQLTGDHRALWTMSIKAEVPSPLCFQGLAYIPQDNGILLCCEGATGKQLWRKRIGGNLWSSPLLCGDSLLITAEEGTTTVLRCGREYSEVARNQLDCEGVFASLVPVRGRLLIRSTTHLYCIGSDAPGTSPAPAGGN